MKRNEINGLKTKSVDELRRILLDLRENQLKLAVEKSLKKVKDTNAAKRTKRDIARVLTFLSMKMAIEVQVIKNPPLRSSFVKTTEDKKASEGEGRK